MVKLDTGAGEVRVLPGPDSVARDGENATAQTCEALGTTRVSVLDKVGILKRSPEKIARELDIMARNAAADLGGNAVVATDDIEEGERRYRVLRCPGPS